MAKSNVPAKKEISLKDRWEKIKQYFRSVFNELKKVHWPGKRQLVAYTGVVLFSVALVAIIIWVFDMGLSLILEKLFNAFA